MLKGQHSYDAHCDACPTVKFRAIVSAQNEEEAKTKAVDAHPRPRHGKSEIHLHHSKACLCQMKLAAPNST
jgi:hypothetical protein